MESDERLIRVGSRKSELALIQTKHVISRLQEVFPNKKFAIHTMTTIGDRVLNISLPKIGEKSLFTRDLEEALRNEAVDFVVHSLKDLPTSLPSGMTIGAVLAREDARDALVLRANYKGCTIGTLPNGCIIGTSSLRRTAQIRRQYPNLVVCDIRGNLNTRLAKLDAENSKFAGIILAQAGLLRMGWYDRISQTLDPTDLLYAVGQGALAVECRANDTDILNMLRSLMCLSTSCRILAERSFLKSLGGGCSAPVAVFSKIVGGVKNDNTTNDKNSNDKNTNDKNTNGAFTLILDGAVWSLDGSIEIRDKKFCSLGAEVENKNIDSDSTSNEGPPIKRLRSSKVSSNAIKGQCSPPIINDDAEIETLAESYNVTELVEKHINLARKCPAVKSEIITDAKNYNQSSEIGGGDADSNSLIKSCPLKIEIGTDVMGQCPLVAKRTKIAHGIGGTCPMLKNTLKFSNNNLLDEDKTECSPSTSFVSKCLYLSKHNENYLQFDKSSQGSIDSSAHGKCPYLRTTVKLFDYSDGKQPQSQLLENIVTENEDSLFCGLYQHACHNRELYVKCNRLGQQLAEDLIKKGALDVMKSAQNEIHSKS